VSDIFLSYAREDREVAERLATEFTRRGWSLWWDQRLEIGRSFDKPTEQALAQAGCVVVLWSRASVESDWVKAEATEGRERGVLVPVLIENVTAPLEFRRLQTGRLIGWSGNTTHDGFEQLVSGVARMLRKPAAPVPIGHPAPPARPRVSRWALVALPTVIAVLVGTVLAATRVPTGISLTLPVQRMSFTVADGDSSLVRILDPIAFPAITFERFESVSMEPAAVAVADPSQYLLAEDRYPETAWKSVTGGTGSIRFAALEARLLPSLTIERLPDRGVSVGSLRPITLPAGSVVTLEVGDARGRSLTVTLSHAQPALAIPMEGAARLTASGTSVSGYDDAGTGSGTSTWRIDFRQGAAPVAVNGRSGELVTSITLPAIPPEGVLSLFSGGALPISAVDFSAQDDLGRRVSSVTGEGELRFLDDTEPRRIESSSVVTLAGLRQFNIRRLSLDSKRRALLTELDGVAATAQTERGPLLVDHRHTAFAAARGNPVWMVVVFVAWLFATATLVYRNGITRRVRGAVDENQ